MKAPLSTARVGGEGTPGGDVRGRPSAAPDLETVSLPGPFLEEKVVRSLVVTMGPWLGFPVVKDSSFSLPSFLF